MANARKRNCNDMANGNTGGLLMSPCKYKKGNISFHTKSNSNDALYTSYNSALVKMEPSKYEREGPLSQEELGP